MKWLASFVVAFAIGWLAADIFGFAVVLAFLIGLCLGYAVGLVVALIPASLAALRGPNGAGRS